MIATDKTFGALCGIVLRHISEASMEEIRQTYNEFLREHDFKQTKRVKRTIVVTVTDSFTLDNDLLAVHEVYLNDEKLVWMDYREYLEGTYTTNDSYTIFDGMIYFPTDLALTDTLYIITSVLATEQDDFEKTDILDIANYWFNVAVNYIVKELYSEPEYFDANQVLRFEKKYTETLEKAISQVLDLEGFRLKVFDDLDINYGWE